MSSKLTPEIRQKIIENLATNPSIPSAAVRAGIAPSTLRDWLSKGEAGDERFAAFAADVAQSRAVIKDSVIAALIETATDTHHPQQVRAAAKLLESLYPLEFANVKHAIQHAPKDADYDLSKLPTAELRALRDTVRKIQSQNEEPEAVLVFDTPRKD